MSVQAGTLPVNHLSMQQQSPMQSQIAGQTPYQQGFFTQSPMGALTTQTPGQFGQLGQFGQQTQFGHQQTMTAAPMVSEVTLRLVSTALATITEQVRVDPQALQTLYAQGQLTPQSYANVLVEAARRCAPIIASVLSAAASGIGSGIGHQATGFGYGTQQHAWQTPYGQTPYGQIPYGQPFGAMTGTPISPLG
jgi:hypothetical protein